MNLGNETQEATSVESYAGCVVPGFIVNRNVSQPLQGEPILHSRERQPGVVGSVSSVVGAGIAGDR